MRGVPPYERGMHDLESGCHAWCEPPGSWGLANSGVVVGEDEVLVVDTQNDMRLARDLRSAVDELAQGRPVTVVVNTHSDGDHWNGNLLFEDARIVASDATLDEMGAMWLKPDRMAEMVDQDTAFGRFISWRMATFDFEDWRAVLPSETFSGRQTLHVGGRRVELIEVGPAHTRGDTVVNVPSARVVFAGDVLFTESTPIVWAGPISGCIVALDTILACEPRVIVPGHGPVVTPRHVTVVRDYFDAVLTHATACFQAGETVEEAYGSFELGPFRPWPHASRLFQNLVAAYRELDPAYPAIRPPEALETVLAGDDGEWMHATCGPSSTTIKSRSR